MWIGRALARSFFQLQRAFGWRAFSRASAAQVLTPPAPNVPLRLSRLAGAGWLVRIGRDRYVAMDARWAMERPDPDPLAPFRSESYYPTLVGATAGALQYYGTRLQGLVLFGSAARRTHTPDSDVDLLLVAEPLPTWPGDRLDETRELRRDLRTLSRPLSSRNPVWHDAQFVSLTPQELRTEPAILLDMTQDAAILYDPSGLVAGTLARVTGKLRARGARRVTPSDGIAYWELSPGAQLGEVREL